MKCEFRYIYRNICSFDLTAQLVWILDFMILTVAITCVDPLHLQIVVPSLPGKALKRQLPFRSDEGLFDESFIEERRMGLEQFINRSVYSTVLIPLLVWDFFTLLGDKFVSLFYIFVVFCATFVIRNAVWKQGTVESSVVTKLELLTLIQYFFKYPYSIPQGKKMTQHWGSRISDFFSKIDITRLLSVVHNSIQVNLLLEVMGLNFRYSSACVKLLSERRRRRSGNSVDSAKNVYWNHFK